jgi:transposase
MASDAPCDGMKDRAKLVALRDGLKAQVHAVLVAYDQEIALLGREISTVLVGDVGYLANQTIPGVGPVLAAVFVAEIGDVHRFAGSPQLCSWQDSPRHHESDTTMRRGPITKQGPLVPLGHPRHGRPRLPGAPSALRRYRSRRAAILRTAGTRRRRAVARRYTTPT